MRLKLAILLCSLTLAGCTPAAPTVSTLRSYQHSLFALQVADTWQELTPQSAEKQLAYFTDSNEQKFKTEAVAVYHYPAIVTKDTKLDAKYCSDSFTLIIGNTINNSYQGIFKKRVEVRPADATLPAHCEFEFELFNQHNQELIERQLHLQKLFVLGKDELIFEFMTNGRELTPNLTNSLQTLKITGYKPVLSAPATPVR